MAILITYLCDFSQNFLIFWWPNFLLSCNHSLILSQQSGLLFYFPHRSCSCCIRCKRMCWCWVGLDQERWLSSWCRYWEYVMCWCHEPRELRIGRVCFCLTLKPSGLLDSWESIRTKNLHVADLGTQVPLFKYTKLIGGFPCLTCKCNDQHARHPLKKIQMRILAAHSCCCLLTMSVQLVFSAMKGAMKAKCNER